MKIKYLVLLIFLFFIFSANQIRASMRFPLQGKVVVIDSGHGGLDSGTSAGGILEKDINLAIALKLEEELSSLGAMVILTRDGDYDLATPKAIWRKQSDFDNRIKIINNDKVDLYLSIHLNYLEKAEYSGPQIFYNENKKQNKLLAEIIQKTFNENLNEKREIKLIPSNTYMYKKLLTPGVLIECGFLSNYNERKKLITDEYQQKIARLIVKALEKVL